MFPPSGEIHGRLVRMVSGKGKGAGSLGLNLLFSTHFDSLSLIQFEGGSS